MAGLAPTREDGTKLKRGPIGENPSFSTPDDLEWLERS